MELQQASNKFCSELYNKIVDGQQGNVVVSPLSIQTALTLAYFGASGETANEIKVALKLDQISKENIAELYREFISEFKKNDGFKMATKIAVKKECTVKPSFNEVAINSFDSEIEAMDFSNPAESTKAINDWVAEKTENTIKDLLKPDFINSLTAMILVNAIYFKGDWVHQFLPSNNFEHEFYLNETDSINIEFMNERKHYRYGNFDELNARVLELEYENSDASFLIVLPVSRTGLSDVEAKLNDIDFNDIASKLDTRDIELSLPKFRIELQLDLNEFLKNLGIQKALSDAAEFNDLLETSTPLKLSKAVHKCFIEVNEKGTEASASTGFGIGKMSRPKTFSVDHPFLFVLKTKTNVVFIGRCCEPKM
jgi:serpin B